MQPIYGPITYIYICIYIYITYMCMYNTYTDDN